MSDPTAPKRFAPLTRETMTPRQLQLAEAFLGFSLNGMKGPFIMMLRSPEAAERFQAMGSYLRFETGIEERLIELIVLLHARLWNDQYEWLLHAPRAEKAGLPQAVIEALRAGRVPANLSPEEQALFGFALELERDRKVSDAAFAALLEHFGEKGVADITFVLGQYAAISMLLIVSEEGRDIALLPPCGQPFSEYRRAGA